MKNQIRPALASDAPRLASLGSQVWLHTYAYEGVSDPIARYVQAEFSVKNMQSMITDKTRSVLVIERGEYLRAYVVLHWGQVYKHAACELQNLYLQEHATGQGLGSALLAAACELAQTRGSSLWLMANTNNTRALRFYQKHGFVIDGEKDFMLEGVAHKNWLLLQPSA